MRRPPRSLVALLQTFVDGRRGLRFGSLFGAPAVFVGRRVAIRLDGPVIAVRLAPAGHDLARAALPGRILTASLGWLRLAPPRDPRAVSSYLLVFERAVREVAAA